MTDQAPSEPSPCQAALALFAAQQFERWRGLPAACTRAEVLAAFPPLNAGLGRGLLGDEPAEFQMLAVGHYPQGVRFWFRGEQAALLDVGYPAFLKDTVARLGEPDARLDYTWKRLLISQGQWVYAARGLALYTNSENGALIHLTVFAPTTLARYEQALMLSLRTERLPRRGRHRCPTGSR